ncbi:tyrosinase family protein [Neolewinella lacunae]|uniref:Tyrosinase family protein n=1 Tax=Neolewinella lacunae TaxID=1517758 RepID=A0A923PQY0_9BACT|nr:tyrosinase family protein [Neolewinella lacunae]MBC6995823.1 tyrosinase family protein [Neolewinella lacunae]MDN3636484.1 tyrosinase family protein [Neolewinella lacunae]
MATQLRVRYSIQELQDRYNNNDKGPLEKVMQAWAGIKALPPDDPNSFFVIGGYHGEPFVGAGWGNASYWGGFCNHGNVLFPTWHRAYLVRLEQALQSIPGCEDVMQPYWDETSQDSMENGIPWALTDEFFPRDSTTPNPLRSFVFPAPITDNAIGAGSYDYTKPAGYETVRYPLSGLVGKGDIEATKKHNSQYPDYQKNVQILNDNIVEWLNSHIIVDGKPVPTHVGKKYQDCLLAPNYTVFSNTTSASEHNASITLDPSKKGQPIVVPLESPHNSIHLAVGGYDYPGVYDKSPIDGANGDMGENNTAGLDPIFFFHHCNVDRVFWLWQKFNGHRDRLEIIDFYPGTNSVDSQGPTPGTAPNSWLTMSSPLDPFRIEENGVSRPVTSLDMVNIEEQLGYTYSVGSLDDEAAFLAAKAAATETAGLPVVQITNVNRAIEGGSFLVAAEAVIDGKRQVIGHEAVLSRWNVQGCANCQNHLEVRAHFALPQAALPQVLLAHKKDDGVAPRSFDHTVTTRLITRNRNVGRLQQTETVVH